MKFSLRLWLVCCWIGVLLGIVSIPGFLYLLEVNTRSLPIAIPALLAGPMLGLLLGFFQWLALRRRLPGVALWIVATTLASGPALALAALLNEAWSFPTLWLGGETSSMWYPLSALLHEGASGAVFGLIVGALQAVSTRGKSLAFWRWTRSSTLAWFLAFGLSMALLDYVGLIGGWLLLGAIVALVTGLALQADSNPPIS